ncbi:nitroreductase [Desulfonatronospira thiodismutans ASO3-1]|uniref:Nitroreductase n=1 Tax=Desulfonatronospira thiodismutans ASO3-1 TaxID=555779 RepID=D6SMB2_9BACT|nr:MULTISPECIES: nitroreductase family protein [Desulfonatronospira]EFI35823.1 nitroreductase [Desulfonatronospira thiodismutans ASO3-1]RQD78787.1 MAG: nitroreductase family protein [Desulfonatronospira sp. MSAO_Bac3]
MDVIEAIMNRRSIRKYKDKPVTDEQIKTILEAAMVAPSAGNAQPWHFIICRDKETQSKVKEINPYAAMADKAPLGILVCADLSLEKFPGYWVQDCSAATQNILLAAHSLGLGSVWTGIHPIKEREEGFQKLFNLPDQVIPLAYVVIGYPDQDHKTPSRYKPERIHYDKW